MPQRTGTHDFASLLSNRFQSVADFGVDNIAPLLQAELDAHNSVMEAALADMVEVTPDVQRIYGSAAGGDMVEADEFAVNPTQKAKPGSEVAFPLKRFEFPIGWTREFFLKASVADMAIMQQNAQIAHRRAAIAEMRRAIYGAANYTFVDKLGAVQVSLSVKRFINADGAPIPSGPNGEVYNASTETHFTAEASLSAAGLKASIQKVTLKSGNASLVKVAIHATNEDAVRALTGFQAAEDPRFLPTEGDPRETLVLATPLNRKIGYFAGAEVWIKPWTVAGYAFTFDAGTTDKPLAMRVEPNAGLRGLVVAAELPNHPLYARVMEARFGFGVYNRRAGACHEFGVDTTYTSPSL